MNKLLTIVIPSYNAEKFLNHGIPSFLDEKILDAIEILIVDDGSKDNTASIADSYQLKYPSTITAIHKENGGHGSTINTGIANAHGKYFCVVDADDWVDTDNFVNLVEKLSDIDVDLVLAPAAIVNSDNKVLGYEKIKGLPVNTIIDLDNYIQNIPVIYMHNYYIKTNILKSFNIKCHEHHFYVDEEYVMFSLLHVKTVFLLDSVIYQYWVGRDGQSVSIASRRKNMGQYLDIVNYLSDFYYSNKSKMTKNQQLHYQGKIALFTSGVYSTLMSYNTSDKKQQLKKFDLELKEKYPDIYHANRNLCVSLLRISKFSLYRLCSQVYRTVNHIHD